MAPAYLKAPEIARTPRHGRRLITCDGKAVLPNYREAGRAAERLSKRSGKFLEPYRCTVCSAWHVGALPPDGVPQAKLLRAAALVRNERAP